MRNQLRSLLQQDFLAFACKALQELDDTVIDMNPYVELYATKLTDFCDGSIKRLVVNMPPRHGKSTLGSICCPAWILAHNPSAKIMIVTYSKDLAEEISRSIRDILRSDWFKQTFSTRIAKDHAKSTSFATTDGGKVYGTSFDGSITGFGADIIIIDDPHDIDDARNTKQLEQTVDRFYAKVVRRLNNRRTGRIMVVAHRIHEEDLSAHLLEEGGWIHLALPLIASRDRTYQTAYGPWHRKKGELLRPDADDISDIEHLRKKKTNPPFELLYQQDAEGLASHALTADHFPSFEDEDIHNRPRFISIDPGIDEGDRRSYSVIQVWACDGVYYYLVDQVRKKCDFRELLRLTKKAARGNIGAPILIENTANGPALLSALGPRQRRRALPITPRESKAVRLRRHYDKFLEGRVRVKTNAAFRDKYISEIVKFPRGGDDQVDATTMILDFVDSRDDLDFSRSNVTGAGTIAVGYNSQPQSNGFLGKQYPNCPMALASNSNHCAAIRLLQSPFDASSLNSPYRPQMPNLNLGAPWWHRYLK